MIRAALTVLLSLLVYPPTLAGQAVLPVPSDVKVDGVPPIPMTLVDAVSPYAEFRQARFLAWHPSARRILIQTAFGNVQQVHEVRAPGAARTQLTFYRDGVTGGASWDPAGRVIVFRKDTGGGAETAQLFRYDPTGSITLLTDGASRNDAPVWARRSGLMAFDSTKRDGKNRDIYVMDPADPASARMVARLGGWWMPLDWSPDDRELLALESVSSSSETYLWRIDVATGKQTAVTTREDGAALWLGAQYGATPDVAYALGDRGSDRQRLWRVDLRSGRWTAVSAEGDAIETFAISRDGRFAAVAIDRDATSHLQVIDLRTGRPRTIPQLPPGVVSRLEWRPNALEIGIEFGGARTFRDVFSIDLAAGTLVRWTASESGGVNAETLPDAELIRWRSFDGTSIPGVLYRPPPKFTGPRPVMINVHGGPAFRERPRALGRSNYFRNELGIAIIYPNIRGSEGYGRAYEQMDNGLKREDAVKDIGALLDWIATQPGLDSKRVMITGSSYGGYVTLASAIAYGDRLRCAFEGFGISDFVSYLSSTEESRRLDRRLEYGDPSDPKMKEFLTRISPLTNASRLKIPLFIAQGGRDTRVPLEQSDRMAKAVKAAGIPLWYVVYSNAGHEEFTRATNDFNIYAWVLFVKQFLLN